MQLTDEQVGKFAEALESAASNFRRYVTLANGDPLTDRDARRELLSILQRLGLD